MDFKFFRVKINLVFIESILEKWFIYFLFSYCEAECLRDRDRRERREKRERSIDLRFVGFLPKCLKQLGQARLKKGVQNCVSICFVGERHASTCTINSCLLGCIYQTPGIRSGVRSEPRHSNMGFVIPRGSLNCCTKCPPLTNIPDHTWGGLQKAHENMYYGNIRHDFCIFGTKIIFTFQFYLPWYVEASLLYTKT